jgi:hypothetical protein
VSGLWGNGEMVTRRRKTEGLGEKPIQVPLSPPANSTCTDMGANLGICGERPETNRLNARAQYFMKSVNNETRHNTFPQFSILSPLLY